VIVAGSNGEQDLRPLLLIINEYLIPRLALNMEEIQKKVLFLKDKLEQGFIDDADEIIAQITNYEDPYSIELLVPLFDDEYPYDEAMYSIIHSIETFDDNTYVKHILRTIPNFIYNAPRWASIVHMRILNSDETRLAYIKECAKNATLEQRVALKKLLTSINEVDTEFLTRTVPLLGVL
jgi:hypothetical protein